VIATLLLDYAKHLSAQKAGEKQKESLISQALSFQCRTGDETCIEGDLSMAHNN
jgi:hypothetical protein